MNFKKWLEVGMGGGGVGSGIEPIKSLIPLPGAFQTYEKKEKINKNKNEKNNNNNNNIK